MKSGSEVKVNVTVTNISNRDIGIKMTSNYLVASASPNRLGLRSLAPRICSYSVDLRLVPRPRSV
jgi:hypothetical protein